MSKTTSKLGFYAVLFIFAFFIVFPFNLVLISPYYDTTKTIDMFFILSIGCFFFTLIVFQSLQKKLAH